MSYRDSGTRSLISGVVTGPTVIGGILTTGGGGLGTGTGRGTGVGVVPGVGVVGVGVGVVSGAVLVVPVVLVLVVCGCVLGGLGRLGAGASGAGIVRARPFGLGRGLCTPVVGVRAGV